MVERLYSRNYVYKNEEILQLDVGFLAGLEKIVQAIRLVETGMISASGMLNYLGRVIHYPDFVEDTHGKQTLSEFFYELSTHAGVFANIERGKNDLNSLRSDLMFDSFYFHSADLFAINFIQVNPEPTIWYCPGILVKLPQGNCKATLAARMLYGKHCVFYEHDFKTQPTSPLIREFIDYLNADMNKENRPLI